MGGLVVFDSVLSSLAVFEGSGLHGMLGYDERNAVHLARFQKFRGLDVFLAHADLSESLYGIGVGLLRPGPPMTLAPASFMGPIQEIELTTTDDPPRFAFDARFA